MKWRIVGLLVAIGAYGYLGFQGWSVAPYFVNKNSMIGVRQLKLYGFQPIVLGVYESGERVLAKAVYLQGNKLPKVVDLWLTGDDGEGTDLGSVRYIEVRGDKRETKILEDAKSAGRELKFGGRVYVEYFGGDTDSGELAQPEANICNEAPRMCAIHKLASADTKSYFNFSKFGVLPKNIALPVLGIKDELVR